MTNARSRLRRSPYPVPAFFSRSSSSLPGSRTLRLLQGFAVAVVLAGVGLTPSAVSAHARRPRLWPVAVSAVGARTVVVMEVSSRCDGRPSHRRHCGAVLFRTDNQTRRYRRLASPPGVLGFSTRPSDLRFANRRDGWVTLLPEISRTFPYPRGPLQWTTHDGGRHWHRSRTGSCVQRDSQKVVAATAGYAFAVARSSGACRDVPAGQLVLERSPVSSDRWRVVALHVSDPTVAVRGPKVWLLGFDPNAGTASSAASLYRLSTDAGRSFASLPFPCNDPGLENFDFSSVLGTVYPAEQDSAVWATCLYQGNYGMGAGSAPPPLDKTLESDDGGRTYPAVHRRLGGSTGQLAALTRRVAIIGVAYGPLQRTTDGGQTYRPVHGAGRDRTGDHLEWAGITFSGRRRGLAVRVGYAPLASGYESPRGQIWRTSDAGRSWRQLEVPTTP